MQISYKYEANKLTHNIYVQCKKNVKKIPVKIINGNIVIKAKISCKDNEQKGISVIYPLFTNHLKLLYRIGTKIKSKVVEIKNFTLHHANIQKLQPETFYKIDFLYNYLGIISIIIVLFTILKFTYHINKNITFVILVISLLISFYLFFSIDIYYIETKQQNHISFACRIFGSNKKSTYNLTNKGNYLYPVNGKLIIDFDANKIHIYARENLYLSYLESPKHNLLFLQKVNIF